MTNLFRVASFVLFASTQSHAAQPAAVAPNLAAGEIIISQRARMLYFTLGRGQAIAYPVAVAKHGKE